MASLGSIYVDLLARTSRFDDGMRNATRSVNNATSSWNKSLGSSKASFGSVDTSVQSVASSLKNLAGFAAGALSVREVIRYSDTWTNLESRLSLVTDSSAKLIAVEKELFAISQQNSQPVEDTIDAYTRLNNSLTDSQKAHTNLIQFTDLLSKTLLISGTNAEGAATFFQQFGQAASSDFKAIGQELQTFADQNPRFYGILKDEAAKYGKSLKDMAKDGELSFNFISDAVTSASASIESDSQKIAMTVGKSLTQLNNSLLAFIGNSEDVTSVSALMSSAFLDFSKSLDQANANGLSLQTTVVGLTVAFMEFYQNILRKYQSGSEFLGLDGVAADYKKRADDIQEQIDRIGTLLDQDRQISNPAATTENKRAAKPDLPPAVDKKAARTAEKAARKAERDQVKALKELNDLYEKNETYITGIDEKTIKYGQSMDELATLFDKGKLSQEQYYTALSNLDAEYDKATEKASLWAIDVESATKRAAENIQDTLADFLFDPFKDGLDGMLLGFVNVLRKMAAEAASATLLKSLFGEGAGQGLLGGVTGGLNNLFGGAVNSANNNGFGPITWDAAPKFATGIDTVPYDMAAVIHQDEAVLNKRDAAAWRSGKGTGGNTYQIDARGADQGAVRRIEQSLMALAGPGVIEQRVSNAQRRGDL